MPYPTPAVASGMTTSRAQSWVASPVKQLLGVGTPPSLERWTISYGVAFFMLSVLCLGAPELAASLAMIAVVGNVLANGQTIARDINTLEGAPLGRIVPDPQSKATIAKNSTTLAHNAIPTAPPLP
jgi:hypothetical protein